MIRCPKCGKFEMSRPAYDEKADVLRYRYRCFTDGYGESRPPRDRQDAQPDHRDEIQRVLSR